MPQPIKKSGTYQKPRSKTVKKRRKPTVSEMIKRNIARSKKPHPNMELQNLRINSQKNFWISWGLNMKGSSWQRI